MIDFHSHILPQMDDGADCVETSLSMLRESFQQGVDTIVSTSHFYADEDYPQRFLERRMEAFQTLQDAMLMRAEVFPEIILGAEVLYFPGMSQAYELEPMMIGSSRCMLVEPPMTDWTDSMLDEIFRMGINMECQPVIAHVDRYISYLKDESLISRVLEREMLVQVNAGYFLDPKTTKSALKHLKQGDLHLIGSDCHNMNSRKPNLGRARRLASDHGLLKEFEMLSRNAAVLLKQKG